MTIRRLGAQLMGLPGVAVVMLVRLYQVALSPILGGQCRFSPSCSNYFIEAVRKRGAIRGTLMGIRRILRCHPLGKGGWDPVK